MRLLGQVTSTKPSILLLALASRAGSRGAVGGAPVQPEVENMYKMTWDFIAAFHARRSSPTGPTCHSPIDSPTVKLNDHYLLR